MRKAETLFTLSKYRFLLEVSKKNCLKNKKSRKSHSYKRYKDFSRNTFGGAYRNKSEKYGLVVDLCHNRCHIFGKEAAHRNPATMREIRRYGQRKVMEENGWTTADFIREFGKDYEHDAYNETD